MGGVNVSMYSWEKNVLSIQAIHTNVWTIWNTHIAQQWVHLIFENFTYAKNEWHEKKLTNWKNNSVNGVLFHGGFWPTNFCSRCCFTFYSFRFQFVWVCVLARGIDLFRFLNILIFVGCCRTTHLNYIFCLSLICVASEHCVCFLFPSRSVTVWHDRRLPRANSRWMGNLWKCEQQTYSLKSIIPKYNEKTRLVWNLKEMGQKSLAGNKVQRGAQGCRKKHPKRVYNVCA